MFKRMESLVGSVTKAWRSYQPDVTVRTTAQKGSEADLPYTASDSNNTGLSGLIQQYYDDTTSLRTDRVGLYYEYDEMDEESPEFASALDIYADNATRGDSDDSQALSIWAKDAKT